MSATRLRWLKDPDAPRYRAECGEEGQGRVVVWCQALAWEWAVDMLPGDSEPVIRSARSSASAFQAMDAAQKQVDAWPTVIDGAARKGGAT